MRKTAVKPKVKTESRTAATAAEEVDHNLRRMEKSEDNGSFVTLWSWTSRKKALVARAADPSWQAKHATKNQRK